MFIASGWSSEFFHFMKCQNINQWIQEMFTLERLSVVVYRMMNEFPTWTIWKNRNISINITHESSFCQANVQWLGRARMTQNYPIKKFRSGWGPLLTPEVFCRSAAYVVQYWFKVPFQTRFRCNSNQNHLAKKWSFFPHSPLRQTLLSSSPVSGAIYQPPHPFFFFFSWKG